MKNEQYKALVSAYMHFSSIHMVDILDLRGIEEMEKMGIKKPKNIYEQGEFDKKNDKEKYVFMISETMRVLEMLEMAKKNNFNFYLVNKVNDIEVLLKMFVLMKSTLGYKRLVMINDAFLDIFHTFKFEDFLESMELNRKNFKIVNASELDNYCEIKLTDESFGFDEKEIYAGDFISKKKLKDQPIRTFEFTIDGDNLVSYYLTRFWINYNNAFVEHFIEELKEQEKNEQI